MEDVGSFSAEMSDVCLIKYFILNLSKKFFFNLLSKLRLLLLTCIQLINWVWLCECARCEFLCILCISVRRIPPILWTKIRRDLKVKYFVCLLFTLFLSNLFSGALYRARSRWFKGGCLGTQTGKQKQRVIRSENEGLLICLSILCLGQAGISPSE